MSCVRPSASGLKKHLRVLPEPVPQIHASSAMPSTLDAQSVHQCVMRLLDLATTLAKTLEDGGESGQLRQGGWDGAHHPPPPMSMRPSNTSSANSSRLLTENDVNSPPANNLRPDEPASINTPVSEQVDERSDTTVGGDGQHLKKRRRVDEVGSSQLNPRAHSNFSILHANDYFSPETSNPLTEGHGDSPFSSTQVSAKHPSSQEKSGIKRRPKEEKEPIRAVNKYLETVLENCGPGDRTQDKAQPTTSKDVNFAASTNEIIAVMRIQMNKWYPLLGSNEADDGPIKILPANQPFHVYLTQQLPLRLRMWLNGKGNEVENLPDYEIQGSTLCDYLDHWLSGGHFNVKWEGCAQTNICVTIEKQKQEMTIFFGWKRGREALRRIYESRPKPKDKR
ncbi:uncharacterized protein K444DRAFT_399438 [Hyaloscypha bicolor E]|uniref:Uncharacterized protein n=1 Tax=Hyaloscypha bicolor E TaxID=1095630 RepID=A0A2J6TB39_9HELO|nr:uncharacterized protein K444DRAFT_399438 [Hyaloscypha bicolor E]PMD60236.1 hypothetical protein K444DRAFT_399438 [Hyaloscypha bicolor E]